MQTNILVEAKKEYTKHVCNLLSPLIVESIQKIYTTCREECEASQNPELLRNFQQALRQIPKWNQDIIDKEYQNIVESENCDILDDLIKAVFIANIKILSSVSSSAKPKKIEIEIPSSKRFVHKCFIESAREIYKDPFLLTHEVSALEQHRNLKEIFRCVRGAIEESIRLLLPVKQILHEYLNPSNDVPIAQYGGSIDIPTDITPSPPRSPRSSLNKSKLFPSPLTQITEPTPLMKILQTQLNSSPSDQVISDQLPSNQSPINQLPSDQVINDQITKNDEPKNDELNNDETNNNESNNDEMEMNSEIEHVRDAIKEISDNNPSDNNSYHRRSSSHRGSSYRNLSHHRGSSHHRDSSYHRSYRYSEEQDDIKAIVLGKNKNYGTYRNHKKSPQKREESEMMAYNENNYGNNRNKKIQFLVEKEIIERNNDRNNNRNSLIYFDRKHKKNLHHEDDGSEDFNSE